MDKGGLQEHDAVAPIDASQGEEGHTHLDKTVMGMG